MSKEFNEKVALITGGTRGIGLSIAQSLLALGAKVAITSRNAASLDAARSALGPDASWLGWTDDLAEVEAPVRVVTRTVEHYGQIDYLFNNAGIAGTPDFWDITPATWDQLQQVNLRAAFFCAREAAKHMRQAGRGGAIVNVSSIAGQIGGVATGPGYVASKAGLIGVTKSLARHCSPFNVRVNCLAPADIETDMVSGWSAEMRQRMIGMTPLGRFGNSGEVSDAALFLASDAASFLTGQTLNINGGIYMG